MTAARRGVALLALFLAAGTAAEPTHALSPGIQATRKTAAQDTRAASAEAQGAVAVRDIRRTISGDVVRVTIQLDAEVIYRTERLDRPPRVLFDLPSTSLGPAVAEGTISYSGDAVRHVRVGRHPNQVTRVVLDLTGVKRYSVFTLYSPYRIVVDCERGTPPDLAAPPTASVTPPADVAAPRTPLPRSAPVRPSPPPVTAQAAVQPLRAERLAEETLVPPPPEEIIPEPIYGPPVAGGRPLVAPAAQAPPPLARPVESAGSRTPPRPMPVPSAQRPLRTTRTFAPARRQLAWQPLVVMPPPILLAAPPGLAAAPPASGGRATTSIRMGGREEVETVPAVVKPPVRPAVAKASDGGLDKSVSPAPTAHKTDPSSPRSDEVPITPPLPPPVPSTGFSMARQLGLGASRIVIDPGHGGHDPGAGGSGAFESAIVLDVALRLEKLLVAGGIEAVLTRRTDQYIPLEERTAIANRARGDLFLSIHANASRRRAAGGVETYVLNFASNPDAEAVAARENASTGRTMSQLTDMVKAITLNNKLDESRTFAAVVQREMVTHLKSSNQDVRDHGVKQAPFVVLIGASMPSVLVEISFITNRQEVRLLKTVGYRQKIAQALFDAIRGYQRSLKTATALTNQ